MHAHYIKKDICKLLKISKWNRKFWYLFFDIFNLSFETSSDKRTWLFTKNNGKGTSKLYQILLFETIYNFIHSSKSFLEQKYLRICDDTSAF